MYERRHRFFTLLVLSFSFNLLPLTKCAEISLVGKNAAQSTTYEGPNSDAANAVDGKIDPYYGNGHCSHTDVISRNSTTYAWWTVDLVDRYVVQSVNVYNRQDALRRLQQFNVRVGDNSDPTKQPLCAYYAGEVPDGGSDTINCTSTKTGRYITIQKTSWINQGILTLCEVKATGYLKECSDRRWGVQTCKTCNCNDKSEVCDKRTGACASSGCKEGYTGTGCDVEKPKIPDAPVAVTIKSRSVGLRWRQWRSSDGGQGPVIAYKIQYRRERTTGWSDGGIKLHTADGQDTVHTVNGLAPGIYRFRVVPIWQYEGGSIEGTPSPQSASGVYNPCVAPEKPVIRGAGFLDKKTDGIDILIRVTWQKLSALGHHCVRYKELEVIFSHYRDLRTGRRYAVNRVGDTEVTITAQSSYGSRQYYVAVRVTNNANFYNTSDAVGIQTAGTTTAVQSFSNVDTTTVKSDKRPQQKNPSAGLFAGVAVTIVVVIFGLVITTCVLVMRHRRRAERNSSTAQDTHKTNGNQRREDDAKANNCEPLGVQREATRQSNVQQDAYEEICVPTYGAPDLAFLESTGPTKQVYEQLQNNTYSNI